MVEEIIAKQLKISGIVQGVGFRPFVYQLAKEYSIKGEVSNTSSGVTVHIEGNARNIDLFCTDIIRKTPPLAHTTDVLIQPESPKGFKDFSIVESKTETHRATLISPDMSICGDCLKEIFDPMDRRYQYPGLPSLRISPPEHCA